LKLKKTLKCTQTTKIGKHPTRMRNKISWPGFRDGSKEGIYSDISVIPTP